MSYYHYQLLVELDYQLLDTHQAQFAFFLDTYTAPLSQQELTTSLGLALEGSSHWIVSVYISCRKMFFCDAADSFQVEMAQTGYSAVWFD